MGFIQKGIGSSPFYYMLPTLCLDATAALNLFHDKDQFWWCLSQLLKIACDISAQSITWLHLGQQKWLQVALN